MMEQLNNIKAIGDFFLKVVDNNTGKVLQEVHENNLVVLAGKTNLTKLLGGDAAGLAVTSVGVGTNGSVPADSDTTLTSPFSKDVDSVGYSDLQTVDFNFTIADTEANGKTIREFGLLDSGGNLFARKKVNDIAKTSAIQLVGIWKIRFV